MNSIQHLAQLIGFHSGYNNCFNDWVEPKSEALEALVNAMGYDTRSDEVIKQQAEKLATLDWKRPLAYTEILPTTGIQTISLTLPVWVENISFYIELENGTQIDGGNICVDVLPSLEQKTIDGQDYKRFRLELPQLTMGYHTLCLTAEDKTTLCHLIVAPQTCLSPQDKGADRIWGIAVQVYSLHSSNSWGMGDFSDLKAFVTEAAKRGANAVGLNPLHPLFPGNPAHRSPYSPSSRSFLNTMYIDVTAVPNYADCKAAQTIFNEGEFQLNLGKVRSSEFIDYGTVGYLKYKVLKPLFEEFVARDIANNSSHAQRFNEFRTNRGESLEAIATYDALYAFFRESDDHSYGWTFWPSEYRDPHSDTVVAFKTNNPTRITYYCWLQWLAHEQMQAAQNAAQDNGMSIGLYLDLAVGCDGNGAEVWADQSSYLAGAAVGAPPDAMNILGQDWGLTPVNPVAMKQKGFAPLIKALRSSMQYAGALRIDHILGFMRQYWVAPSFKADEGIYITFPMADMLRVIALESHRNGCVVIGEDLGTVPDGFGEIMAAHGLLSYKVMFFERWENGLFMRPDAYPYQSMATCSTHDLHTVAGWWTAHDLQWRRNLNLYPNDQMAADEAMGRLDSRDYLRGALLDMELMTEHQYPADQHEDLPEGLGVAIQQFIAKTNSAFQMIPAEDLLELKEQVNIPGTTEEHPNWKRKLPVDVTGFFDNSIASKTMQAVDEIRT